jgi:hypothetical protein
MFIVVGYGLYYTWNKSYNVGYTDGYGEACYDVAKGNITVSLTPPSEMD